MNFTKFTAVLEKEITKIDLTSFIRWIMVANLMPVMETTMAIITAIDFFVSARRLKELKDTVYQFDSTRFTQHYLITTFLTISFIFNMHYPSIYH